MFSLHFKLKRVNYSILFKFNIWFRVLETGINNPGTITDIVCFYYAYDLTLNPGFIIWPSQNLLMSTTTLNLNQWNNFAFILKGSTASVYINGVLADQKIQTTPLNVIMNSNFVGGSNWPADPLPTFAKCDL